MPNMICISLWERGQAVDSWHLWCKWLTLFCRGYLSCCVEFEILAEAEETVDHWQTTTVCIIQQSITSW